MGVWREDGNSDAEEVYVAMAPGCVGLSSGNLSRLSSRIYREQMHVVSDQVTYYPMEADLVEALTFEALRPEVPAI